MNFMDRLNSPKGIEELLEDRDDDFIAGGSATASVYTEPDGCNATHCSVRDLSVDGCCYAPRSHKPKGAHQKMDEYGETICGFRTIRSKAVPRPKGNRYVVTHKLEDKALAYAALDMAIKELKHRDREIIRLWYVEGRDAQTIGDRLHMSRASVYMAKMRAIRAVTRRSR